jgi:hypothetical protein
MTIFYNNPGYNKLNGNSSGYRNMGTNQLEMTLGAAVYLAWVSGFLAIVTTGLIFGSSCTTQNDDEKVKET